MAESNALATLAGPFNLNSAAERLKDQIRGAFVELLTPEQWQSMIQAELVAFTQARVKREYGREERLPSVLSEICEKVFREFVEKAVREALNDGSFRGDTWNGRVGQFIATWLRENQDRLIQSTILQLAGMAAQNVVSAMANAPKGY